MTITKPFTDVTVIPTGATTEKSLGDWLSYLAVMLAEESGTPPQFKIITIEGSNNYWQAQGAVNGNGPGLSVAGPSANIDGNIASKGTGSVVLGNGVGAHLKVGDAGDGNGSPDKLFTIRGGAGSSAPRITSNYDSAYDVADTKSHYFYVNGSPVLRVGQSLTGNTSMNYLAITGSSNSYVRFLAEGGSTNIGYFFNVKGNAGYNFWVGSGGVLTLDTISGIADNGVNIRGRSTGNNSEIRASGVDTDVGVSIYAKGNGINKVDRIDTPGPIFDTGFTIATATDAGTTTLDGTKNLVILNPAGTIASHTVALPISPLSGQRISFTTTNTITTLTLTPGAGQTIVGAPSTITSSTPFALLYSNSLTKWVRVA